MAEPIIFGLAVGFGIGLAAIVLALIVLAIDTLSKD